LPNKAVISGKDEKDWAEIDGSFLFKFSLYPNDYVELVTARGEKIEGYYRKFNRANMGMGLLLHRGGDDAFKDAIGCRSLSVFKKFQVDYFGCKHEVIKERRGDLAHRLRNKQRTIKLSEEAVTG
jgi:CRISPR-associated endonuclease Csn1